MTLRHRAKACRGELEPTALGAGAILALLLVSELSPYFVSLSAGTRMYFTTPAGSASRSGP